MNVNGLYNLSLYYLLALNMSQLFKLKKLKYTFYRNKMCDVCEIKTTK